MKREAIFLFLFVILIGIISSQTCVPNWSCEEWSTCVGDSRHRSCIDLNNCDTENTKLESDECEVKCTPRWICDDWMPERCPENGTQTRECKDLNTCGLIQGKDAEVRMCDPQTDVGWLYLPSIVFVIVLLIVVALMIREYVKKR